MSEKGEKRFNPLARKGKARPNPLMREMAKEDPLMKGRGNPLARSPETARHDTKAAAMHTLEGNHRGDPLMKGARNEDPLMKSEGITNPLDALNGKTDREIAAYFIEKTKNLAEKADKCIQGIEDNTLDSIVMRAEIMLLSLGLDYFKRLKEFFVKFNIDDESLQTLEQCGQELKRLERSFTDPKVFLPHLQTAKKTLEDLMPRLEAIKGELG